MQQRFSQYLLHQDIDLSALEITGPFTVPQLMSLYRNNFYISLSEYLLNCFPTVEALVGEAFFSQLAKAFILKCPLECASVEFYGAGFSEFIAGCEQAYSVPYLADIAQLDWAFDQAKSVVVFDDFPFAQLQLLNEHQQLRLYFQLQPKLKLMASNFPALSIWQGVKKGNLDNIDMQEAEFVMIKPDAQIGAQCSKISIQEFDFLNQVQQKTCLQQLANIAGFQPLLNQFISNNVIKNFILEGDT
jgi:hypothetical protein